MHNNNFEENSNRKSSHITGFQENPRWPIMPGFQR